jgi:hypothetical protein
VGLQVETRLPEGTPSQPVVSGTHISSTRELKANCLENSPGTQPAHFNLMTRAFTTILHGHHLLVA